MPNVRPIKVIVAALGGQGGGVVSDWLVSVARLERYLVQATSVPGVAQRTGATIYYLEFFPRSALPADGRQPVMALMPHPGDVDVVVASELMEAGRALQRGVVTRDKTTLIASSNRVYAIAEKSHLADGRADAARIEQLAREHSKRFILFDMQAVANAHGSVISAAMLGALAGSGALPFARESYRQAIEEGGIAVKQSLAAFDAAAGAASAVGAVSAAGAVSKTPPFGATADHASATGVQSATRDIPTGAVRAHLGPTASVRSAPIKPTPRASGAPGVVYRTSALPERLAASLSNVPPIVRMTVEEGARRLIDYQDISYAQAYLERLQPFLDLDRQSINDSRLTEAVARGLALWMSFEDTIRVADLKIRASRSRRVGDEVRAGTGQLVSVTEFMKPRIEEIYGTLPASLARRMQRSASVNRLLARYTGSRQIRTSHVSGFLLLYVLAGMRRWRRGTLRFNNEDSRIRAWLADIQTTAATDYDLAVEIAECQKLVRGYGETHERGARHFDLLLTKAREMRGNAGAAARIRDLRAAAIADEEGLALKQALAS
jgi:indolepyruvate ferredoxin oxidoreductase beta subunit